MEFGGRCLYDDASDSVWSQCQECLPRLNPGVDKLFGIHYFCHLCSISVALQSLCFFSVFVSISSFFELLWLQKLRIYRTAQLVGILAKNCFLQAFVFRCWLPEYVTYRKSKIDETHKKISCKQKEGKENVYSKVRDIKINFSFFSFSLSLPISLKVLHIFLAGIAW